MVGFIKDDAVPTELMQRRFGLLFGNGYGIISGENNKGGLQLLGCDFLFIFSVIDESLVTSGSEDFRLPLLEQDVGQNNEGAGNKIGDECCNHHNGFTESHFIGNETAVNWERRVSMGFQMYAPLDTIKLITFSLDTGFFEEPIILFVNRGHT